MVDVPELRILFIEDIPSDAELAERVLSKNGLKFRSQRVETREGLLEALVDFSPDVIISDYNLPTFDGMQALDIVLETDRHIPFIIFTGSLNEETAVSCMRSGASDYILKDRIKRLPFSVREALEMRAVLEAKEKAESSLLKSEETLQLAMEVSKNGFWDWNMDSGRAYFSDGWCSMFGYGADESPGSFDVWTHLLHPDDCEKVVSSIRGQLNNRKVFHMDFRVQHRSGKWLWVTGRAKPFDIDENGVPHRAIGTCIDITNRKLAEQQMLSARIVAEEANRYKNEMISNISHEFRTPLSSVIGFSDVLLEGLSGSLNPMQKEHLITIKKGGHRLLELVNNMLDISIIGSGEIDLVIESFDPVYVIHSVLSRTRSLAAKSNIAVSTTIDPDVTTINADADKVTSILYNLVENSLKFTQEGGNVLIDIRGEDDMICISVQDSGIGIKEGDLERIFEPFVQLDGSATRKQGGTGLGLMLVREYVRLHNGMIDVKSEFGEGSTFTIRLPQNPPEVAWHLVHANSTGDELQ